MVQILNPKPVIIDVTGFAHLWVWVQLEGKVPKHQCPEAIQKKQASWILRVVFNVDHVTLVWNVCNLCFWNKILYYNIRVSYKIIQIDDQ